MGLSLGMKFDEKGTAVMPPQEPQHPQV
jgi:hypothetical protein